MKETPPVSIANHATPSFNLNEIVADICTTHPTFGIGTFTVERMQ